MMRLTCPNCGAQYDVDADVVPKNGRDVQCSSCGHTWFQRAAQANPPTEQSPETIETEPPAANDQPPAAPEAAQPSEPEFAEEPDVSVASDSVEDPDIVPEKSAPTQRPAVDPEVSDILRSEANRESAERAQDGATAASSILSEGLGPDDGGQVNIDMSDDATMHRGDLLPDIEEINSTLSADNGEFDEGSEASGTTEKNKRGFRRGFIFAVVVFAVLALVYVFAREIADAFPPVAPALSGYVDWINQLRLSIDGLMLSAVEKLTGLLTQLSGDSAS